MRTINPSIIPSMKASLVPMRKAAKAAAEAQMARCITVRNFSMGEA